MTVTNVTPPTIVGTAKKGTRLTSTPGTWTHSLAQITYDYQWERCNSSGASCVDIAGATSAAYTPVAADVGGTLRLRVHGIESNAPATIVAPANLATIQSTAPTGSTYLLQGSFGDQTFTQNKEITFIGDTGATLGNVEFRCASGSITLQDLAVGVVTIGAVSVSPGGVFPPSASDIVLDNLDGTRFNVHWAERIQILGGDWGLSTLQQSECRLAPYNPYDGTHVPTDILIDGAYIHNFGMTSLSGNHSDGIQTWGMVGVVIRNCTFHYIGGTGCLTMEFLDYNYLDTATKNLLNANHSLFPSFGHVRIYDNESLDLVSCAPVTGGTYCAYYDVQQSQLIPDYDYTQVTADNTWPRGVYNEPLFGQPQGTGYPWGTAPTPPTPPGWPPA